MDNSWFQKNLRNVLGLRDAIVVMDPILHFFRGLELLQTVKPSNKMFQTRYKQDIRHNRKNDSRLKLNCSSVDVCRTRHL